MTNALMFTVDLHDDILLDVMQKRYEQGETHVLQNRHLESLQKAGVRVQVLPIFVPGPYLPEGGLRVALRTVESLYRELEETPEPFQLVLNRADLDAAVAAGKIALIMAFEGAEAFDRDAGLVLAFHRMGLRMVGLTWNRANAIAQGLAEDTGAGISTAGRRLLAEMERLGMVLDISHLAPSSFWSAMEHFKGRVVASHCNALAVANHPRNLTDEQLQAIAERGGLIGLNFVPDFVGGDDLLAGLVRHADYIRGVVGLQHVALGPDFIDYLAPVGEPPAALLAAPDRPRTEQKMPNISTLPLFGEKLLASGWSRIDAEAVFGGNALRFLREALPAA